MTCRYVCTYADVEASVVFFRVCICVCTYIYVCTIVIGVMRISKSYFTRPAFYVTLYCPKSCDITMLINERSFPSFVSRLKRKILQNYFPKIADSRDRRDKTWSFIHLFLSFLRLTMQVWNACWKKKAGNLVDNSFPVLYYLRRKRYNSYILHFA